MKKSLWLWMIPGLAAVLVRPSWSAWLASVLLSACFQVALIGSFLWPEMLSPVQRLALWGIVGGGWLINAVVSWQMLRREESRLRRRQTQDAFPEALRFYLRGDRARAELVLRQLLREDPRDIEAALLLASVWRRQGRLDPARSLLANLANLEAADPWAFEIRREMEIVERERSALVSPGVAPEAVEVTPRTRGEALTRVETGSCPEAVEPRRETGARGSGRGTEDAVPVAGTGYPEVRPAKAA